MRLELRKYLTRAALIGFLLGIAVSAAVVIYAKRSDPRLAPVDQPPRVTR